MARKPLYILLCSGEHEKIQLAAMTASVAAVSGRRVEVFVSMNAMLAFEKGVPAADRYFGGHLSELFKTRKTPDPVELFGQGRTLGELKMWACSMVLDAKGWTTADLIEELFDGPAGLTKFLTDAEHGELITF